MNSWNERAYYQYLFYFGIKWRHPATVARSKRLLRRFFRGQRVSVIYLSFALSYFRRGDSRWLKTLHLLESYPESVQEYTLILRSLCKTDKPRRQLYILQYSRNCQKMPRHVKRKALCYVAERNPGLAWHFFKQHYPYYFSLYGESQFTFLRLLECVTENLSTRDQLHDVEQFFSEHSAGTGRQGLNRGLEKIRDNMKHGSRGQTVNRKEDTDEIFQNFIKNIDDKELQ